MKKLFIGIMLLIMLTGCAGLNTSTAVNASADVAFTLFIQNNPNHKAEVIVALTNIKTFLNGRVTYDELIKEIAKQLPGQYNVVAIILTSYIEDDKPVFKTYLTLFDDYKAGIITKINRLISLSEMI